MAKQLNVNLAFTADTGKAKAQIQELQTLLNKISYSGMNTGKDSKITQQLTEASQAAKELQIHLNNAFNAQTGNFDLSALNKSLQASGTNIQTLSTKLLNAGTTGQQAFVKLAQSISLADQPMLRINDKLKEFATTLKNTARWQISSSILHGFMGAVQSAYGYAQDLNKSLTDIRIVTGYNADEMTRFAESANKAAKNLSTTTTDYTNASLIYFQQGLTDEEVAKRTEITVKMANAAGQSAEIVSDQLTAVWNNFDDGSKSLEYYADVMTALGAATASSTDEIAGGLEKFAAVADTIGLSYEYAASALATITSNTRQSEEVVGTALKTIFARIQGLNLGETLDDGTTLNKYSQALAKVGIDIFDANKELKNMDTILDEMAAKWDTLSAAEQTALAQTVAGVRQYTQLVALMENWDNGDNDSMMANLTTAQRSTGALQKQADIYAESWEAASDRVRASAEGIYQSLLDDDFFIALNNGLADLLGGLDLLIDKSGGLKTILLGVGSVLLSMFSSKIPDVLNNLALNFKVIKNEMQSITSIGPKGIKDPYAEIHEQMRTSTNELFQKYNVSQDSSLGFMVNSSNELAEARSRLARETDRMSDSERQMAEMELSLIQAQQEEVYTLKQKNEELQKSINLAKQELTDPDSLVVNDLTNRADDRATESQATFASAENFNILDSQYFQQFGDISRELAQTLNAELISALTNTEEEITELQLTNISAKDSFEQLLQIFNQFGNGLDILQDGDELELEEAVSQIEALVNLLPEGIVEATGMKSVLNDIKKAGVAKDVEQVKQSYQKLISVLANGSIESKKFQIALKGLQSTKNINTLANQVKELKQNTKQVNGLLDNMKKAVNSFQPAHIVRTSEALGSLSGLAGNAVTMVNLLSSAIKSLADPDASSWEKISSVLMVVASGVPIVISSFKSLGTLLAFLNQQFVSLGIVTSMSTALQKSQALAVKLNTSENRELLSVLSQEQLIQLSKIAITEKENGSTKEQIALKLQEHLVSNNITDAKTAETISRLLSKTAIDQENVSLKAGLIAKGMDIVATLQQNGHRATAIVLQTILNALTGDWVSILIVVGTILGAIVGGGFIAWLEKVIVTEAEAMQALQERAKKSEESFNKVSEAVKNTTDTLNSIDDSYELIEKMTQGTMEWYSAVVSLNDEVLKLVKNFPELEQYLTEESGVLKINEEGRQYLEGEQRRRLQAANNIKINDQIAIKERQSSKDFEKSLNRDVLGEGADEALSAIYQDPSVRDILFSREYSDELFKTFIEAEADSEQEGLWGDALRLGGYTTNDLKENVDLYKEYEERFYQDLKNNEEAIKSYYEDTNFIKTLEDSKLSSHLNLLGSNRTVEETESLLGGKYSDIAEGQKNYISENLDWNKHRNYYNDAGLQRGSTSDLEAQMIEDFMSLQGDDVEYVAQRHGKMVLKVDGTEIEYDKEEVYSSLAELYATQELENRLTESLKTTLGQSLSNIDLKEFNLNELIQLDNLTLAFDDALADTAMAGKTSELMNQIAKSRVDKKDQGDESIDEGEAATEGLQEFLSKIQNINLQDNAQNLRDFNTAAMSLAEGRISVEDFTNSLEKMSAKADIEGMTSYFNQQAEALGMGAEEAKDMQDYAKHLMEISEESEYLSDELASNADSAADLAVEITRMNKGVETLSDNFKDWNDILKKSDKSSAEYSKAMSETKKALADVLDVESDLIDSDFVTEHLDEIEKAAEGDAEAIDNLRSHMDEEIIQRVTVGKSEDFIADIMNLENAFKVELDRMNAEFPNIEVGAILNDAEFLAAANNLVQSANMTADEANAYFAGIGYEPVYNVTDVEGTGAMDVNTQTTSYLDSFSLFNGTKELDLGPLGTYNIPNINPNITWHQETTPLDPTDVESSIPLTSFSGSGTPPEIKGLRKKATGSSNNKSSSNRGGSNGGKGGGGKGGSGGSGGKSTPAEKVKRTKKSDVVDRYKEINDALDDMADALEDTNKETDRLYGADRIKSMQKANSIIQKEIGLIRQKQTEAKEYLKIDKQALNKAATNAGVSFTFDDEGNITNYTQQMEKLFNQLAAAEDKMSKMSTKEAQDEYKESTWQPIQDKIDELKEAISQYDETRELLEDLENEEQDKFYEWQDNNAEVISYKLELKLEINDMELEEIDYYLKKMENDFYKMAESAALMTGNLDLNLGDLGEGGQLGEYIDNLEAYDENVQSLEQSYKNGEISQAAYIEGLKEANSGILDNLTSLVELDQTMMEYYGETLAAAGEELAKFTDQMEHLTSILDHYQSIMATIGKETDYASMGVILEGQAKTLENEVEVAKASYNMYREQADMKKLAYEQAMASGDESAAELFKKQWEDAEIAATEAQANMMSKTEAWAEALRAVVENKLNGLAQSLENALTGGTSFDQLTTSMERAASLQEEYLTTTNKIYETNKLMRTAQQAIDKSTNSVAKRRLKAFVDETQQLQDQAKLSKYELEIQQAKYDLLLAEIALEEAQDAKSMVRLQRDSEGNFGYVYTADQNAVDQAEQDLADKQNRLYNLALEGAEGYTEKYQQTMAEMYDTLTELQQQWLNGEFETEQEYNEAVMAAKEYYYEQLKNFSSLYQVAITTDGRVIADSWSTDFADMTYNTNQWMVNVNEYLGGVSAAFATWEADVRRIREETVGQDLDELAGKVDGITTASDSLTEAITKEGGVLDTIKAELEQVNALTGAYANVRKEIGELIKKYEELQKKIQTTVKKEAEKKEEKPPVTPPPEPKKEEKKETKDDKAGKIAADATAIIKGVHSGSIPQTSGGWIPSARKAGYSEDAISVAKKAFNNSKDGAGYDYCYEEALKLISKYDTGGYTGEWGSKDGKLAMLHQKELVLNESDTKNLLNTMEMLNKIIQVLDVQAISAQLGGLLSTPRFGYNSQEVLEQNVHIEASFPNVQDKSEIEAAFEDLVNLASQYANRK